MQEYEVLVERAQSGDPAEREEAFSQLIERFQGAAHSWAFRVLDDAHQAQDAVQEAFITAYEKIDQLADPAAFPAWLRRIVLNQCNRDTRRKSFAILPLEVGNPSDEDDPAASAEEREVAEQIERAVQGLPEHEREVTELFYISGYSQQEIAENLALPLTTVKKRLQYAREHLREAMPQMSLLGTSLERLFADEDDPSEGEPLELALSADMMEFLATLYPKQFVTV